MSHRSHVSIHQIPNQKFCANWSTRKQWSLTRPREYPTQNEVIECDIWHIKCKFISIERSAKNTYDQKVCNPQTSITNRRRLICAVTVHKRRYFQIARRWGNKLQTQSCTINRKRETHHEWLYVTLMEKVCGVFVRFTSSNQ